MDRFAPSIATGCRLTTEWTAAARLSAPITAHASSRRDGILATSSALMLPGVAAHTYHGPWWSITSPIPASIVRILTAAIAAITVIILPTTTLLCITAWPTISQRRRSTAAEAGGV